VTEPQAWLAAYAQRFGLSYEPDADERWLRAWEPFITLKTPLRYEHALLATGQAGSITIARFVVSMGDAEAAAWVAIAQDGRLGGDAHAAAASDPSSTFAEPIDLVTLPRRASGDPAWDRVFAAFAATDADIERAVTPSLRKLTLSWRIPLHFEVRPGGFVLAPVSLAADAQSLGWLIGAAQFFGDKAAKRVQ
jgi:hypothetical protein